MEKITSEWNGFRSEIFEFNGQKATVIFPENSSKEKKWLFKTEYLDAFPSFELEMLKRGYFVANIENETRWGAENDTRRQIEFAKLLVEKADVAVAPGIGFGEHGDDHVRIALVENEQRIRQAARNIRRFLETAPAKLHNVVPLAMRR